MRLEILGKYVIDHKNGKQYDLRSNAQTFDFISSLNREFENLSKNESEDWNTMKVYIKDCGDKRPTASLIFYKDCVKGQILLNMVDGVFINTEKSVMSILNNNQFSSIEVDKILHININFVFIMFYELIIDYEENDIVISVRRTKNEWIYKYSINKRS